MLIKIAKYVVVLLFLMQGAQAKVRLSESAVDIQKAVRLLAQGKEDAAEAVLLNAANQGMAEAYLYLSQLRFFGQKHSVEAGMTFLRQAIKLGCVPAMDVLAGYYLHGEFIKQDHHQAILYYKLAADQGYGPSQFNYGIMRKNGEKTPRDLGEAFVYLARAALNNKDLDDITQDAAFYRDEVARQLSPEEYRWALGQVVPGPKK